MKLNHQSTQYLLLLRSYNESVIRPDHHFRVEFLLVNRDVLQTFFSSTVLFYGEY